MLKANHLPDTAVAIRAFLEHVVAWPMSANESGWINLHCHLKNTDPSKNGGKHWVVGWPFKTMSDFLRRAAWVESSNQFFDVWFCTSQQRKSATSPKTGRAKAVRNMQNAAWIKAVWVDIDIKPDDTTGKYYTSIPTALLEIRKFRKKNRLPTPSAIVNSGGGLHVYWIADKPMAPEEWRIYAEGLKALLLQDGLKCDAGLTTDIARILRVPGTLNHKYDPARMVKLVHLGQMYNFPEALSVPHGAAPTNRSAVPSPSLGSAIEPGNESSFESGPNVAFGKLAGADSLAAGIRYSKAPLDPAPVFEKCGFMRLARDTGGVDYDNTLWMYSVLCATFLKDGNTVAHEISKRHPTYTENDTQKMYERKLADRNRGIGYPGCQTIHSAGCKACATCPFLADGKSPLHLTGPITVATDPSARGVGSLPQFATQQTRHPNAALKDMVDRGEPLPDILSAMNEIFAVVRYGDNIVIANMVGNNINFMKDTEFHKMLANQVVRIPDGKRVRTVQISRTWFDWELRKQYIGRGAVFEPGGPLEIQGDMLNIFRGFGVQPAPGIWSLMQAHILRVLCSGRRDLHDYFIRWMACGVQNLDEPIGVAVALLGEQGAGKGIFARTFGSLFGDHFAHIANGDQLTGRFNASVGKSCFVFLDEAVWAGDKKGEGVLKALITEPTLQLEAKFKDPITVQNRLRIMVASNNEWAVPAGIGDRRWLILNISNKYAGTKNSSYFAELNEEIDRGGAAAMLHDLLSMDLNGFNVRDVPRTAAKADQQALSLPSVEAWLYQILQEGTIEHEAYAAIVRHDWQSTGLMVAKDTAYAAYQQFSCKRKDYRPTARSAWSKLLIKVLGPCLTLIRHAAEGGRIRSFRFADLSACRDHFARKMGADFAWDMYPVPPAATDVRTASSNTGRLEHLRHPLDPTRVARIAKDVDAADQFIATSRQDTNNESAS